MQIESQKRYRTFLIILVYIIMTSIGIRFGINPEFGLLTYLIGLLLALLLTQICIVDGRIVGRPLPVSTHWLVLILFPISIPICFFRVHGTKGLVIVAAHLLGLLIIFIVSSYVMLLLYDVLT